MQQKIKPAWMQQKKKTIRIILQSMLKVLFLHQKKKHGHVKSASSSHQRQLPSSTRSRQAKTPTLISLSLSLSLSSPRKTVQATTNTSNPLKGPSQPAGRPATSLYGSVPGGKHVGVAPLEQQQSRRGRRRGRPRDRGGRGGGRGNTCTFFSWSDVYQTFLILLWLRPVFFLKSSTSWIAKHSWILSDASVHN